MSLELDLVLCEQSHSPGRDFANRADKHHTTLGHTRTPLRRFNDLAHGPADVGLGLISQKARIAFHQTSKDLVRADRAFVIIGSNHVGRRLCSNKRQHHNTRVSLRAKSVSKVRATMSELESLSDPANGELRIGTTEPMTAGLLWAIVDQLSRQHPRVAFHVKLGDPSNTRAQLSLSVAHSMVGDYILNHRSRCRSRHPTSCT